MVATTRYPKFILLILVSIVFLIGISGYSEAKDLCRISIIVKDSSTFNPIAGARVYVDSSSIYIGYTNETGMISFKAEATHEYTFRLEKSGYYTEKVSIKCWPNDSTLTYVYLTPTTNTQISQYYCIDHNQETQSTNQDFYTYFPQSYIEIPANSEKIVDLYACSRNDFFGFVSLTPVYSNGIKVDVPFLVNLPKNSCIVEKVKIYSDDSYGYHYLYVYAKQRDKIVFSNRLTIYVVPQENSVVEKAIIPILNVTENVVEKGKPLLVEARVIAKGVSENTYISVKLKVDDKIIKRDYFKIDEDSIITLNEIINTNYFGEGYHYVILEVSTRDLINSTSKLVKFIDYSNENVYTTEGTSSTNAEASTSSTYHCLEIVDLRNYYVKINETNKIHFTLHNCGSTTEKNIKIITLVDGKTLINTIDDIEPNEYRVVTVHIAIHEPFDEYITRLHVYNQNVSIDAGFKLIELAPDVKLVVKDAYTASVCSDVVIPVKIINAGKEPEKITLNLNSPINYTIDETTFTIDKKSTVTVPVVFHIPCNTSKNEYLIKFLAGSESYYTTIKIKGRNIDNVEVLIWFILAALILVVAVATKKIEIGKMKCWRKHRDELVV